MKQSRSTIGSASLYAAMVVASVTHDAAAQDADQAARGDTGVLEAVIVTAERREQKLHETPTTVAVVDPELLERSVRKINDLAGFAPGVTIATRTYTPAIFIRGVGSTRPIGNQSVGIYLDDVYIARPFGAGLYGSLPDTQRIEVLSGPQGTLYGKNTGGGALKLVTVPPPDENTAWISVAAGDKTNEARAYGSAVLVPDVLNGSLAFAHNRIDDDIENVTLGKDVNGLSSQQARGLLKWTPSDTLKALLSVDGMKSETDYVLSSVIRADRKVRRTFSDIDPTQDYEGWGISGTVEKLLGEHLQLKSITAFRDASMIMPTDSDGEPGYLSGFVQDLDMRHLLPRKVRSLSLELDQQRVLHHR
ncbi:TonB-dependent receptor [Steroidobacter sp.]|uniref:TonB-dependent receptor n=1 Tax=Steroidobacter sp. TaxID=1978227 RepID=UPI001A3BB715|nr:TonB-dependent receptor plug domain-containing protein [Steroidobacter sp.]MBL8267096.1 TonB-dependent receptor plug domain-containing protein [Steroidobacter sp.]